MSHILSCSFGNVDDDDDRIPAALFILFAFSNSPWIEFAVMLQKHHKAFLLVDIK
jgi:hypothetical protein